MKKNVFTLLIGLLIFLSGYAQKGSLGTKMGFGFQLAQYQSDFGIGLNITSPFFAGKRLAIRSKGNVMWNQHLSDKGETVWTPYANLSFGVVGVAREIGDFLRLYGEGGMVILYPSNDFSEKKVLTGGYGLFGFEFFMDGHSNYYIEIGGIGTGAVAEKAIGKPIYSNGLLINVGYRYQF